MIDTNQVKEVAQQAHQLIDAVSAAIITFVALAGGVVGWVLGVLKKKNG